MSVNLQINLPVKPKYKKVKLINSFYTIFTHFQKIQNNCFLFESLSKDDYDSRYSILGFDPEIIVWARGAEVFIYKNQKDTQLLAVDSKTQEMFSDCGLLKFKPKNPYFFLKKFAGPSLISKNYAGGLIGYMSHEAVNYLENNLDLPLHSDFDQYRFGVYTDGLVLDKLTGESFYFYYTKDRSWYIQSVDQKNIHQNTNSPKTSPANKLNVFFEGDQLTSDQHSQKVEQVLEEIRLGNTFQCEVGFKSKYKIYGDDFWIYSKLRQINPSPFMFYLKFDKQKLIGASPELLLRVRNKQIETFPLAGSIGRGQTLAEDTKLTAQLLNDPKEIAEHLMLVDMHRNDLGRVAKIGTVKIRKFMDIVKYSTVQHISSEITGILDIHQDMFSALAAIFPGGVLTGAPKIESIKIINNQESEPRGPYGGAVGHFGFNGDCTFCIPIRSLFINQDRAFTQTCSGIVAYSEPAKEYQEILHKLAAMKKTLASFGF